MSNNNKKENSPYQLEELFHMELIFQNTGNRDDPIGHSYARDYLAQMLPLLMMSIAYHTRYRRCKNR